MSATQALVGERIAMAMGPMIEETNKVQQVFDFIHYLNTYNDMTPLITQAELDRDCMPLGTAMDKLRQKAQNYFFAAK